MAFSVESKIESFELSFEGETAFGGDLEGGAGAAAAGVEAGDVAAGFEVVDELANGGWAHGFEGVNELGSGGGAMLVEVDEQAASGAGFGPRLGLGGFGAEPDAAGLEMSAGVEGSGRGFASFEGAQMDQIAFGRAFDAEH